MHRPTYAIVCFILLVFLFIIVSCNPYSFYLILCHLHVTKIVIISFYICIMCRKNRYLFIYLFISPSSYPERSCVDIFVPYKIKNCQKYLQSSQKRDLFYCCIKKILHYFMQQTELSYLYNCQFHSA